METNMECEPLELEITDDELSAIENVLEEFSNLTNSQAYLHTFSKRLMKPVPGSPDEFLGCTHRADMIPHLLPLVASLPNECEIFDVGAGAGDVVNFALSTAKSKIRINLEEPNQHLMDQYIQKIHQHAHLQLGEVHRTSLQSLYETKPLFSRQQDLILAMQMIYHLTDFKNDVINPRQDLIDAIAFLYGQLAPGGALFLSYSDLGTRNNKTPVCGIAVDYCKLHHPDKHYAKNLTEIYEARNQILGTDQYLVGLLNEMFPNYSASKISHRAPSYFYADSIADMAVSALASELCESNDLPFDIEKLQFCIQEIIENPAKIGLVIEERDIPQQGMWRGDEPQVITVIRKN